MTTKIYTHMSIGPYDRELTIHDWVLCVTHGKKTRFFGLGDSAGFCEDILGIRFADLGKWVSFALEYKSRPPAYSFDISSDMWAGRVGKALAKYFGGWKALMGHDALDLLSPEITSALVRESSNGVAIAKTEVGK